MYVKDDHGFTRGPGAIAAMDAVSPARRIAAARAELALRTREAIGAAIETGQERAFSQPARPVRPVRPGRPGGKPAPGTRPLPFRPRGLEAAGIRPTKAELIKLPGTVVAPPAPGETKATQTAVSTAAPVPTAPVKTVVVSGGGTSWTAPASKAPPPSAAIDNAPPPWAPEPESDQAQTAPTAPAKKASSSKVLVFAAIGIGALWLLTRSK